MARDRVGEAEREIDAEREREIEARAEARYRELAAYLPDFVATIDRDRRYRWANRIAPGLTSDVVLGGTRLDDYVPENDRERLAAVVERVFDTGEPGEFEVEAYRDGAGSAYYRTRVVPAAPEAGEPRVLLLTSDVTQQKQAELALRASERRVHTILERLPDYVLELDSERRVRFVNRTRPDSSEEAVIGRRLDDITLPEQRDEVVRKLEHLFATGEDVRWSSSSAIDGGSYVVHALLSPGPEPRAIMIAKDITREKDAIARLHASEERLDRAVRAGNIGLWEVDLATRIATGRGWFLRALAFDGASRSLDDWRAAIHPDDVERATRAFEDHAAGRSDRYECEYRVRARATDPWRYVLDRGRVVERAGGARVLAGTSIDVTATRTAEEEHRALERQLEHVQRLESIGLLAGGIAHDFNNLLTVIVAGAECAKVRLGKGESPEGELVEIGEAAMRAAALTQQLLAFGRQSSLELEDVDLAVLARSVAGMAARVFPKDVEIDLESLREGAIVAADRQRLEQVLLNLCVNGRDAMPDGGRLTISVELEEEWVVICVADTGIGIPESDRARIFDPFFTTKPMGAGSGLGLAVAHGIVQQHGGSIAVDSGPSGGTVIRVRLPRRHVAARPEPVVPIAAVGGSETILIADDEPLVLRSVKRTLQRAGYRVLEAVDGAEAVEVFRAHREEIALVFLDVLMPRLDGWKAQAQIREIDPSARILLTSGYSAAVIPEDGTERPALLAKPYLPDALLRAVREALDGPLTATSERA